jgi:hypothetical protein
VRLIPERLIQSIYEEQYHNKNMDKFLIRDKKTKEVKERYGYPNSDPSKELTGFDYDNYDLFVVVENEKPIIDENKEFSELVEKFSLKKSGKYARTRIFERSWEIKQLPTQTVRNKLNKSLGEHLDSEYPEWKRQKHSDELNGVFGEITEERKRYIQNCKNWEKSCREERRKRDEEFLTNEVFPSFEWEPRPVE